MRGTTLLGNVHDMMQAHQQERQHVNKEIATKSSQPREAHEVDVSILQHVSMLEQHKQFKSSIEAPEVRPHLLNIGF